MAFGELSVLSSKAYIMLCGGFDVRCIALSDWKLEIVY
jgi:hypothetical protein